MIYPDILSAKNKKRLFALLVDPENHSSDSLKIIASSAQQSGVDLILAGGSLISGPIDEAVESLKKNCSIPVILFPGSLLQLTNKADGILLLSLLSGRNADFLISNHVVAAPFLKKSGLEVIPTGYLLIDCGQCTSVEYMSHSKPIPYHKNDIAVATAVAGELLGMKLIYLEGGSGAQMPVSAEMIREVKNNTMLPLVVGGGIRNVENIKTACNAGADIIVCGTAIEKSSNLLNELVKATHNE